MNDAIEQQLARGAGVNLEATGREAFRRAVAARMAACGDSDPAAYADRLRASLAELEALVEELTVRETWFFRDRGPFELLEQFARGRRKIRVLSAPCASGEEPYSIAMTLLDAGWKPDRFRIDACDISRGALQKAARGIYDQGSFRENWRSFRRRWFQPVAGGFEVMPGLAAAVEFHREDLLHPVLLDAPEPYEVVFCRNLLIYLRAEAQERLIRRLGSWLAPDGILFVGHAEVATLLRHGYRAIAFPRCYACRKPPGLPPASSRTSAAARPAVVAPAGAVVVPAATVPVSSGRLLRRARELADEGALDEAWNLCEEVLSWEPHAEAFYLQGLISAARDRLAAAEESFRKALYLDPAHYESLLQMSWICDRRGESARGELFRARAARLAPGRQEVLDARRP